MISLALLPSVLVALAGSPADTILMLASRSDDLTGDGRPEQLQLVASGPSVDDLTVTFSILDGFEVLYTTEVPVVFPAGDRMTRLNELGETFFAEERFVDVESFLASHKYVDVQAAIARDRRKPADLAAAAVIWDEIEERDVPIFTFTLGRDNRTAIAWSETDHGFVLVYQAYPQ